MQWPVETFCRLRQAVEILVVGIARRRREGAVLDWQDCFNYVGGISIR